MLIKSSAALEAGSFSEKLGRSRDQLKSVSGAEMTQQD
jgi:hypothetical protein